MRMTSMLPRLLLALTALSVPLNAIHIPVETRLVPTARLVENLERDLKANPRNIQTVLNLARLYAMAYALKVGALPATDKNPEKVERPYYEPVDSLVPARTVTKASSAEQEAAAQEQLKKSIQYYESALALDQTNLIAGLGHAWTLEQAGQTNRAIGSYRVVIAQAWPSEQKATGAGVGKRFFTEEAAGYLIKLLDPVKNKDEIADLQARRDKLRALPRAITPIAIPLEEDVTVQGIVDSRARVRFDADGSGLARDWSWITPDAGWLVYDADDRGSITSALQWFGGVTFWLFWTNGYEALRALDDDGDGELRGGELRHLAIWRDRNRNGVSEAGEVDSLAAHHIVALSCAFEIGDGIQVAASSPRGVTFASGQTRWTVDVILKETGVRRQETE